jgi:quinol monooxygenase YgiN
MASMLIQIKVKDLAEWKKVFSTGDGLRKSNGELSHQVFHDVGDPNVITAIYHWDSVANAQKFARSPELRAMMEKAGVQGPPAVQFLDEVKV